MLDPTLLRLERQGSMTYDPLSQSHSAMPWDAKDSMTYDPVSPPMMFMGYIMDEGDSVMVC